MLVNSPQELLEHILQIFPEYVLDPEIVSSEGVGFHNLLTDFLYYYQGNNKRFTESQVKSFAEIINEAVTVPGDLENAFSTCFLEHLIQFRVRKPLASFLSKSAKERLHA